MNICIIGAGNMGGAIAIGIAQCHPQHQITVTTRSGKRTERFAAYSNITCSTNNKRATRGADIIILAVKPWAIKDVITQISDVITAEQTLISVAGGICLADFKSMLPWSCPIFRVIPNIAASVGESMTFITAMNADEKVTKEVADLFRAIGKVEIIEERLIPAVTALCSCGIAYVFRYIRAATEGAVELGLCPDEASRYIVQTLRGAAEFIEKENIHPEAAIDRVTTPGGITIKGLNAMEECGFSTAVINGLKASK